MKAYFVIIINRRSPSDDVYEEIVAKTLDHYPSEDKVHAELLYYKLFAYVEYARVEKRYKLSEE